MPNVHLNPDCHIVLALLLNLKIRDKMSYTVVKKLVEQAPLFFQGIPDMKEPPLYAFESIHLIALTFFRNILDSPGILQ